MPKPENQTFADIKAAANSSMPVPPIGTNRDRVGMATGSGNPNVLEEAASAKPYGRAKDGPAWREGLRNHANQSSTGKKRFRSTRARATDHLLNETAGLATRRL
jgi:hypothetical protein